jgi:diguanylate cyclase (GGDEF)-like protein
VHLSGSPESSVEGPVQAHVVATERRDRELETLGQISRLTRDIVSVEATLRAVTSLLRHAFGYRLVLVAVVEEDGIHPRVVDGTEHDRVPTLPAGRGLMGRAVATGQTIFTPDVLADPDYVELVPGVRAAIIVPIVIAQATWGVLAVEDERADALQPEDVELLETVANQLAVAVENARLLDQVRSQLRRAEVLRRIGADISSKLDLPLVLAELVDHAMVLFGADRGAVYQPASDGTFVASVSRNLSEAYLDYVRRFPRPSIAAEALAQGRALFAVDYANDPRGTGVRAAVVQEGFDTIAVAPLMAEGEVLGGLFLYHDRRHEWPQEDLDTLDGLAAQAAVAIHNARNYAQMATWAAQIQSIQQLGTSLSRLSTVHEIGRTIATELNQLIDYHNVRVYVVDGEDLRPVAWRGEIGEYTDEVEEQLALKVGQGITGWVALHGVAQNLADAAKDPRAQTIPGTEDDLDESMLIAPMTYEGGVIGVLVLSKLGLGQFSADDLRLLEIYASFAAQAMANANATERLHAQSAALERQLRSQQDLLRITESILSTLDPRDVLEEIADRLGTLVGFDNLVVDVHDREAHLFRPLTARGVYADRYMGRPIADDVGVAGWVLANGEAQFVPDQLADPRVEHFEDLGPMPGALVIAPLRGRDGMTGVLTLERLGVGAGFSQDEFELIKLYAAQASIALQNAQAHRAVEIRAQTDALTGLSNQGTFQELLARAVARGERFSLLMLDLDDFKGFNDSFGHSAGNILLERIARALESAGRETDSVYRYGGDEFCLLLPNTDQQGALAVARKVARAVRGVGRVAGRGRGSVTASIGLASFPGDGSDAASLLLAADRALYVAKRNGRDEVATAVEGLALAAEFLPLGPTPVDQPDDHAA